MTIIEYLLYDAARRDLDRKRLANEKMFRGDPWCDRKRGHSFPT